MGEPDHHAPWNEFQVPRISLRCVGLVHDAL